MANNRNHKIYASQYDCPLRAIKKPGDSTYCEMCKTIINYDTKQDLDKAENGPLTEDDLEFLQKAREARKQRKSRKHKRKGGRPKKQYLSETNPIGDLIPDNPKLAKTLMHYGINSIADLSYLRKQTALDIGVTPEEWSNIKKEKRRLVK